MDQYLFSQNLPGCILVCYYYSSFEVFVISSLRNLLFKVC